MSDTLVLLCGRDRLLRYIPPFGTGAEIGVYRGCFSRKILANAKPKSLTLVDAWDIDVANGFIPRRHRHKPREFAKLAKTLPRALKWRFPLSNVRSVRSLSAPAAAHFRDREFDWIYIDADHSYEGVLADLRAWAPKVKEDGLVIGHDFTDQNGFGVIRAVHDFTGESGYSLLCVTTDYFPTYVLAKDLRGFSETFLENVFCHEEFIYRVPSKEVFGLTHHRHKRNRNRPGIMAAL